MPRYTDLYKNRMLVYKQNETQHSLGRKGKERVALIKSLFYVRVEKRCLRGELLEIQRKLKKIVS